MSNRRLKIYIGVILVNIVLYLYFTTFIKPDLLKDDANIKSYIPVYYSDSLDVTVKSSELSRANFYIRTMNDDSIRVDSYDYLDYRNIDYSNLIKSNFHLSKEHNNDTLWISNKQNGYVDYLIIDSIR